MDLYFNITGFTILKKKINKKGLNHYLQDFRYKSVAKEKKYDALNFIKNYRKPGYFMDILLNNAHKYSYERELDEYKHYHEVYYYTREEIVDLINNTNNNFDELSFDILDRKYYYDLMSELIDVLDMYKPDKVDFYLVMEIRA